jgi:hypothetical protein
MKSYNGFSPAERQKAFDWLKKEYAAGRRSKPTVCDACGQEHGLIMAHSEDYGAPYGDNIGEWGLCFRCHMMVHCRFGNWSAWDRYKANVFGGWQYEAVYKFNFDEINYQLRGGRVPYVVVAHRTVNVLQLIEDKGRVVSARVKREKEFAASQAEVDDKEKDPKDRGMLF